jgi:hypothetical protein
MFKGGSMVGARLIPMVAILACTLSASAATEPQKSAPLSGYRIHQNLVYQGPLDMKVSKNGIHVDSKELAFYLRPTVKGVLALNRDCKKYCLVDEEVWLASKGGDGQMTDITKHGKPTTFNGVQVQEYIGKVHKANGKFRWVAQFWTTKDLKVPSTVADHYARVYTIPPGYGFPLKIVRWYTPNKPELFLSTQTLKTASIAPSDLEPPIKGYQKVPSEVELLISDSQDELADILEEKPIAIGPRCQTKKLK